MKSRTKELLDRSIAATVAAIEIYNKPDFHYREEAFAVLAINGWELLLKARWLDLHNNKIKSLWVTIPNLTAAGVPSKRLKFKPTRSGNPYTHGADYLATKLIEQKHLDPIVWKNIEALMEMRDSAVHFYNAGGAFALQLQEVGSASLKNFVAVVDDWFGRNLHEYNFYLMPLSFVTLPEMQGIVLNPAERNFAAWVDSLEKDADPAARYSVTVNVEVKFTKSKAKDSLGMIYSTNPDAVEVRMTDEQIRERWKWDYAELTQECRARYSNFIVNKAYHKIRKGLTDPKFMKVRELDPGNPRSAKKEFFDPNILQEFDKHYTKKKK